MIAIFSAKWHGVMALIWSLIAFGVTALMIHTFWAQYSFAGFMVWLFVGWLAPVLLLAISGVRRGCVVSRVCALLAIVACVVLVILALTPPHPT
ncbi:MAG: hypothetical protein NTZ16_05550 [Verrucomicrobia bacterium]|nr:hypothetical protein [Verrucomicrobiota bacterium]